jgi:hypothetical protein
LRVDLVRFLPEVLVAAVCLDFTEAVGAFFTLPNALLNRIGTISLGFGCSDPDPAPAGLLLVARFGGILLFPAARAEGR